MTWMEETDGVYGPIVKNKRKTSAAVEKKTGKKSKTSSATTTDSVKEPRKKRRSDNSEIIERAPTTSTPFSQFQLTLENTIDYEEVTEPEVATVSKDRSIQNAPNDEDIVNENSFLNKPDERNVFESKQVTLVLGLEDDKIDKIVGADGDDVTDDAFLSALVSFPPFTISWNAPGGRLSITDAVLNAPKPVSPIARFPSVSSILKITMPPESKFFLDRWEKQMIEELGEEGFQLYKQELFLNGASLHLSIHKYLEGKPMSEIDVKDANKGHWQSLQSVFKNISDVGCLEKSVKHPVLRYKGILDCMADYKGKSCIVDWKTSKKRKPHIAQTYDNPLQLAAYLGAYNCQQSTVQEVDHCLLAIGYEDGSPADVHFINRADCLKHWQGWLRRLRSYWSQEYEKTK